MNSKFRNMIAVLLILLSALCHLDSFSALYAQGILKMPDDFRALNSSDRKLLDSFLETFKKEQALFEQGRSRRSRSIQEIVKQREEMASKQALMLELIYEQLKLQQKSLSTFLLTRSELKSRYQPRLDQVENEIRQLTFIANIKAAYIRDQLAIAKAAQRGTVEPEAGFQAIENIFKVDSVNDDALMQKRQLERQFAALRLQMLLDQISRRIKTGERANDLIDQVYQLSPADPRVRQLKRENDLGLHQKSQSQQPAMVTKVYPYGGTLMVEVNRGTLYELKKGQTIKIKRNGTLLGFMIIQSIDEKSARGAIRGTVPGKDVAIGDQLDMPEATAPARGEIIRLKPFDSLAYISLGEAAIRRGQRVKVSRGARDLGYIEILAVYARESVGRMYESPKIFFEKGDRVKVMDASDQQEKAKIAVVPEATEPVTKVADVLKGKVDQVTESRGNTFLQINVGEKDGVTQGMTFRVHRGDTYLGTLRITIPSRSSALGKLTPQPGTRVLSGDNVLSLPKSE